MFLLIYVSPRSNKSGRTRECEEIHEVSACGFENEAENKFCNQCGASLDESLDTNDDFFDLDVESTSSENQTDLLDGDFGTIQGASDDSLDDLFNIDEENEVDEMKTNQAINSDDELDDLFTIDEEIDSESTDIKTDVNQAESVELFDTEQNNGLSDDVVTQENIEAESLDNDLFETNDSSDENLFDDDSDLFGDLSGLEDKPTEKIIEIGTGSDSLDEVVSDLDDLFMDDAPAESIATTESDDVSQGFEEFTDSANSELNGATKKRRRRGFCRRTHRIRRRLLNG